MSEDEKIENLFKSGDKYYRDENFAKALECFATYIEKRPNDALVLNMIGHLHKKLYGIESLDEQISYYKAALEVNPNYRSAVRNLLLAYIRAEKYEEAFKCFQKLFELDPLADDFCLYGTLKLKFGDFDEGWKYYEYRFAKGYGKTEYPKIIQPRWSGEDISDKIILVNFEQGYGDSLQFCRYLHKLKQLAKKIIFRVQDSLVDLFRINFEGIDVVGESTLIESLHFDCHIPLLSLMFVMREQKGNIPFTTGYLKADTVKAEEYRKKYFDNSNLKIGIVWNGMSSGNRHRNVPLDTFFALAELENVKLYSLQKGEGVEKLKKMPTGLEIIDLGSTFRDFSDTAAAMQNLDIFITSDNSVFNLAGAMGKKTFVMLNKNSEWRWFLEDDRCSWYDNVKIFKKKRENDSWDFLMKEIIRCIN